MTPTTLDVESAERFAEKAFKAWRNANPGYKERAYRAYVRAKAVAVEACNAARDANQKSIQERRLGEGN